MKKIFVGLMMLALSSCYMQGDYTLGRRNTLNDYFYTYAIRYYDTSSRQDTFSETETVSNFKPGSVRYAPRDGVVLSAKTYVKRGYAEGYVRPNMKGAMVSYTIPVEFSDEKIYEIIGESDIKGVTYQLLKPNRLGDVVLIDERGHIYPRVGRIYNDRLALLETSFLLEPEDLKFVNDTGSLNTEEEVVSNFVVRFAGVENYRMIFKCISAEETVGAAAEEERVYTFSIYDRTVSFEGVKLEIIEADDEGVSYKILEM